MNLRVPVVCLTFVVCVAAETPNLTDQYRTAADQLIDAALADNDGYNRLAYLCYRIGNRLSGSVGLERAVAWSVEQMKAAGLSNVRVIPTKVPHWVRGAESARMVAPLDKPLHMLGLGGSIATPPGGINADVVVVPDFETLTAWGAIGFKARSLFITRSIRAMGLPACTGVTVPRRRLRWV